MNDKNDKLEYLFFTTQMAEAFKKILLEHDLEFTQETESVQGGIVLKTPEPEDDELWDELDDLYDELSAKDQALLEEGIEDEEARSTAGIYLQLLGGKQTVAQIDPHVMNRMLTVISMDEFNAFVDTIVQSVENPDDSPICKR